MNSLLRVRFNCDINKPEKYFDENYCREGITVSKSKIKQLSRKDFLSGKKLFEYRVESGYYSFDNETVRLLVGIIF